MQTNLSSKGECYTYEKGKFEIKQSITIERQVSKGSINVSPRFSNKQCGGSMPWLRMLWAIILTQFINSSLMLIYV